MYESAIAAYRRRVERRGEEKSVNWQGTVGEFWRSFGGVLLCKGIRQAVVRSVFGIEWYCEGGAGFIAYFCVLWSAIAGHWRSVVRCSAVRVGSVG